MTTTTTSTKNLMNLRHAAIDKCNLRYREITATFLATYATDPNAAAKATAAVAAAVAVSDAEWDAASAL